MNNPLVLALVHQFDRHAAALRNELEIELLDDAALPPRTPPEPLVLTIPLLYEWGGRYVVGTLALSLETPYMLAELPDVEDYDASE